MTNEIAPSKARIKSKMNTLRASFQALNESMIIMLKEMPDSERDILMQRWQITVVSLEEMFAKYSK